MFIKVRGVRVLHTTGRGAIGPGKPLQAPTAQRLWDTPRAANRRAVSDATDEAGCQGGAALEQREGDKDV
jgi:hypothetical protein